MITTVRIGELRALREHAEGSRRLIEGITGDHRVLGKEVSRAELIREVLCNLLAQAANIRVPDCFVLRIGQGEGEFWYGSTYSGRDYFVIT